MGLHTQPGALLNFFIDLSSTGLSNWNQFMPIGYMGSFTENILNIYKFATSSLACPLMPVDVYFNLRIVLETLCRQLVAKWSMTSGYCKIVFPR